MAQSSDPICRNCNQTMVSGFIADRTYGANLQSSWIEGAPRKSFWTNITLSDAKQYPIAAYRCPTCGVLGLYAEPPAAG